MTIHVILRHCIESPFLSSIHSFRLKIFHSFLHPARLELILFALPQAFVWIQLTLSSHSWYFYSLSPEASRRSQIPPVLHISNLVYTCCRTYLIYLKNNVFLLRHRNTPCLSFCQWDIRSGILLRFWWQNRWLAKAPHGKRRPVFRPGFTLRTLIFSAQCTSFFCITLTTNIHYFPLLHSTFGLRKGVHNILCGERSQTLCEQ